MRTVKLEMPFCRVIPQPLCEEYPVEIPGAERRWDTMSFYDYVETTQALLVSFALTDGAAQAGSYIMSFASSLIKLLK